MSLPGVGVKVADKLLEIREAKGNLELEDLRHVPYLKLTPQLIRCLDFAPFQEGEEIWERVGSLEGRYRERVGSIDQLEEWKGSGPGHPQGMVKDWGQLARGPSKRGKPYELKQEREWWQGSKSPERFEDEYGELDSAFLDRPSPGGEGKGYLEGTPGNNGGSVPGQSKSSSVQRTRRYDFELESSREERDRAYMHDSQNRDTGMSAGYASPREQGLLHSRVSSSQRGNEAHDYSGDMNGLSPDL